MKLTCSKCGHQTTVQSERCPNCRAWGSLSAWTRLADVEPESEALGWTSGIEPLDTLVGGQWVNGCVYRITGPAGCGKSTLALSLANAVPSLYLSGEERPEAVALRMRRLGLACPETFIGQVSCVEDMTSLPEGVRLIIADSLNKLRSPHVGGEPGSNSQLVRATAELRDIAARRNVVVLAIAHVNSDGGAFGTNQVDHDVDVCLEMAREGGQGQISIPIKNRHGPAPVRLDFTMTEGGLKYGRVTRPTDANEEEPHQPGGEETGNNGERARVRNAVRADHARARGAKRARKTKGDEKDKDNQTKDQKQEDHGSESQIDAPTATSAA